MSDQYKYFDHGSYKATVAAGQIDTIKLSVEVLAAVACLPGGTGLIELVSRIVRKLPSHGFIYDVFERIRIY